jgi:hypothetical protein
MTSSRCWLAALGVVLAVLSMTPATFAQNGPPTAQELETARTLYKEGKELRAAGDLKGAVEKLRAAHALGQTPVTGIELARTYVLVGKLVEAREVALQIARLGVASDETEKSADARTEGAKLAEELRPRIPTLTVKIRGLAQGDVPHLSIDGVMVPDVALGEPQKVDPGKHDVLLSVGEGAAARQARASADTPEGQAIEVALDVPPAPALPPPPPPPSEPTPQGGHSRFLYGKIAFGVATVSLVFGLSTGIVAVTKSSNLSGECPGTHCTTGTQGASDLSDARTWATVTNVSLAIAGIGFVAGIVDAFVEQSPPAPTTGVRGVRVLPWVGAGLAGVHGDF